MWNNLLRSLVFLCAAIHGADAMKFTAKPPKYITTLFGVKVTFNCTTDDSQGTVKLHHSYTGAPFKERVVSPGKLTKTGQIFTLIITSLQDAGFYKCHATNRFGNETIQWPDNTGMLFIVPRHILPPIRVEPADAQIILTGRSIDLTCYSEDIQATTLTWFKIMKNDTQVKVPDSQVKVYKTPATNEVKSVLTITNAKKEDSAGYKCRLFHRGGTQSKYASVIVKDPEVPVIEPYSGKTDVIAPNKKNLRCVAKAFPVPQVTWYKDGKPITVANCTRDAGGKVCKNNVYVIKETSNMIYVDNKLKIKQTQYLRDSGIYTCEAKNDYGTASLTINLNVQVAPKPTKEEN